MEANMLDIARWEADARASNLESKALSKSTSLRRCGAKSSVGRQN